MTLTDKQIEELMDIHNAASQIMHKVAAQFALGRPSKDMLRDIGHHANRCSERATMLEFDKKGAT